MSIFLREIKYTLINLSRDKSFVFWTFLYPIILASFFYLAFAKLMTAPDFTISVGIDPGSPVKEIIKEIDILKLQELDAERARQALRDKEISSYIDENSNLVVAQSGMPQTTVKNILDSVKQMFYYFENNQPAASVDFSKSYINVKEQKISPMSIIFYTLLAMVSFYGFFGGIEIMRNFQANISELGKRMSVSPIKKGRYILSAVLITFGLNVLSNIMVIFYINYVLGIKLFVNYGQSILLVLLGNLWGICFSIYIGSESRLSFQVKTAIGIGLPILLAFLSGMMGMEIKAMIMKYAPILDRINPAAIITNGLYRSNLLSRPEIYWEGIGILLGGSIFFLMMSVRALRRNQYDSF